MQQAEAAQAEAERLHAEASAAEAEAERIEAAEAEAGLPEAETVDAWRALAQQREVAEARLGVGLSVVVQRSGASSIEAERDGGEPHAVELGVPVEAQRRIALRLGDDTSLEIVGGDAQARADRDALEARWREEVVPALRRLAVDDLVALRRRMGEAQQQRAHAQARRRDAEAARSLAAARTERAAELPALQAALDACERALAGLDRAALEERAGEHDEATLQSRRTHAEARIEDAQRRHAEAKSQAAALGSEHRTREQEHERLAAALKEATARMPGDLEAEREAAFDRLAAVEGEQETVEAELAAHDEARARHRQAADQALREARAEADRTRVATSVANRALQDRRESLAQAQGQLAQLDAQAERIDEPALAAELERQRDALGALPEDEPPVTAADLAAAREALAEHEQAVREIEAALGEQRGALKQVGGAVAREEAERTREALQAAEQTERDLLLDYEAWRLLAETLREAETAEGRHLGEALGQPIHERFAALTGGRYGALSLGRDLRAAGLEVAGDLRDVGALSEGVQDQLATILRLAVAEHLGTALVLDDHLAQTDPARVAWFRELLVEVGQRAQIVVLTCRPEDYLRAEERPAEGEAVRDTEAVRAIDLQQVIRRAGLVEA